MALQWKWDAKIGSALIKQGDSEYEVNLYQGNAFLIFISEWTETTEDGESKDKYQIWSFFLDEYHAKNCLGLTKESSGNIFDKSCQLVKIRINKKKYTYTKKLVEMLIKAFDEIQIDVFSEDGEENVGD